MSSHVIYYKTTETRDFIVIALVILTAAAEWKVGSGTYIFQHYLMSWTLFSCRLDDNGPRKKEISRNLT
jgi:phosphomannomutase